jgi:hypothetical protein
MFFKHCLMAYCFFVETPDNHVKLIALYLERFLLDHFTMMSSNRFKQTANCNLRSSRVVVALRLAIY